MALNLGNFNLTPQWENPPGFTEIEELSSHNLVRTVRGFTGERRRCTLRVLASNASEVDRNLFTQQIEYQNGVIEYDGVMKLLQHDPNSGCAFYENVVASLARRVQQRPLTGDEARSVLVQLLQVVAELARLNRKHGDICPENLYLAPDSKAVKLTGFVVAYDADPIPRETSKVFAPEVFNPDSFGAPTAASADLYHVGYTVIELLLGKKFSQLLPRSARSYDETIDWSGWHLSQERAKSLRDVTRDCPDDLVDVLHALTSKPVSERPRSAEEALARIAKHERVFISECESNIKQPEPEKPIKVAEQQHYVEIHVDGRNGQIFRAKRPLTIGSDPERCDVVLTSSACEKLHAVLGFIGRSEKKTATLFDLRTRRGLTVRGRRVRQAIVSEDEIVQIGEHQVRIHNERWTSAPTVSLPADRRDLMFVRHMHEGRLGTVYKAAWNSRNEKNRLVAVLGLRSDVIEEHHIWERLKGHVRDAIIKARPIRHLLVRYHMAFRVPEPNRAFLVMDWMNGGSLSDQIKLNTTGLPLEQVYRAGIRIGQALEGCKAAGIVHRMIDPSAIFFNGVGRAYLGGLVFMKELREMVDAESRMTTAGQQFPREITYVPPDCMTMNREWDSGADLYSLCVTLFFALTGHLPFAGGDMRQIVQAMDRGNVRKLTDFKKKFPRTLDDFFRTGLQPNREDRFRSVGHLVESWRAAIPGMPSE